MSELAKYFATYYLYPKLVRLTDRTWVLFMFFNISRQFNLKNVISLSRKSPQSLPDSTPLFYFWLYLLNFLKGSDAVNRLEGDSSSVTLQSKKVYVNFANTLSAIAVPTSSPPVASNFQ